MYIRQLRCTLPDRSVVKATPNEELHATHARCHHEARMLLNVMDAQTTWRCTQHSSSLLTQKCDDLSGRDSVADQSKSNRGCKSKTGDDSGKHTAEVDSAACCHARLSPCTTLEWRRLHCFSVISTRTFTLARSGSSAVCKHQHRLRAALCSYVHGHRNPCP